MKPLTFFFLLFLLISTQTSHSQTPFRVMWYNVENLFDTIDNPLTEDDEFTPQGKKRWTTARYNHKLKQLAKVIESVAEETVPVLIGLCEIENEAVLKDLIKQPSVQTFGYKYCLAETEDIRGIRVALLYQPDQFRLINYKSIPVALSDSAGRKTRNMLHVWGTITNKDTVDVLITHFPSRYDGVRKSEPRRLETASILKNRTDSVTRQRVNPYIIIMGDMNDFPGNKSLKEVLAAEPVYPDTEKQQSIKKTPSQLYNILPVSTNKQVAGTYKYRGKWNQLDHLIVNGTLLNKQSKLYLPQNKVQIFAPSFLFTEDETKAGAGGIRPKRTYYGFKYEAGYSDHLPIIADFLLYLHN